MFMKFITRIKTVWALAKGRILIKILIRKIINWRISSSAPTICRFNADIGDIIWQILLIW